MTFHFTTHFRLFLLDAWIGRPTVSIMRACMNMKVGGNERPLVGLSEMVSHMGIGDRRLWLRRVGAVCLCLSRGDGGQGDEGRRGGRGEDKGGAKRHYPFVSLLLVFTRRTVYVLCHTHMHVARFNVYITSRLSLPLPPFSPPFTPARGLPQVHGIDVGIGPGSYCRCGGNRGCRPSPGPYSDDIGAFIKAHV